MHVVNFDIGKVQNFFSMSLQKYRFGIKVRYLKIDFDISGT